MDLRKSMAAPCSIICWHLAILNILWTVVGGFGESIVPTVSTTTPGGYVQLDATMKNMTKYEGETLRIKCEITGFPLPRYIWYKDGVPLDKLPVAANHFTAKITPWGSRLKIEDMTVDDSGVYTCEGSNSFAKQATNGTVIVKKGQNPNKDWLTDLENDGDDLDLFDVDSELTQLGENPEHDSMDDVRKSGNKPGSPKRKPDPVRPGKDPDDIGGRDGYCQPYRGAACARFVGNKSIYVRTNTELGNMEEAMTARLTLIATSSEISQQCAESAIPALCHFAFPLCDMSSLRRSRPLKVCLEDCETLERTACKAEYGPGRKLNTKSDKQTMVLPDCEQHADTSANCIPLDFSSIIDSTYDADTVDAGNSAKAANSVLHIIIPCLAIPICLGILIVAMCLYRRCHQKDTPTKQVTQKSAGDQESMLLKPTIKACDFPISSVRFLQELGEGSFGKVCRGELVQYAENSLVPIVIKTLRPNSTSRLCTSFWSEAERASELKHPNILTFLGICSRDQPFCMLFEYFVVGDLQEYLVIHSPNSDISFSDSTGRQSVLRDVDMMGIAIQISAGMDFLSSRGVVHGDIAARNMLVGEPATIKISDLGISRTTYPLDYYSMPGMPPVPVRWMPSEALQYGKFSTKSDVWSYGVTLWEVYSYGLQPYYGHSNQDVVNLIQLHQILPCPKDCSSRIYSLMVECWHKLASHRPNFRDIHQRLCQWQTTENNFTGADNSRTNHLATGLPYNLGQSSNTGAGNNTPGTVLLPHQIGYPHDVCSRPPMAWPPYLHKTADPMSAAETQLVIGNTSKPLEQGMQQQVRQQQQQQPVVLFKKPSSSASSGSQMSASNHSSQSPASSSINKT